MSKEDNSHDKLGEMQAHLEKNRETIKEQCVALVLAATEVADSMITNTLCSDDDKQILSTGISYLWSFVDNDIVAFNVSPHVPSKKDKLPKLFPREHRGVEFSLSTKDNTIIYVMLYGGMRDPKHPADYNDRDRLQRQGHAPATIETVSKQTFIGMRLVSGNGRPLTEIWITHETGRQFRLNSFTLFIPKKKHPSGACHPTLQSKDQQFSNLDKRTGAIKTALADLIPSVPE